ncbi:hypothetical protein [Bosea sp. TAF32]|uniref:hypothetical protein n=1 Tax=Bosea sp. TAF32 TaxID=3237482 RepID=UPI003F90155A
MMKLEAPACHRKRRELWPGAVAGAGGKRRDGAPLVIVVAALVRTLVRIVNGKYFRPAETPIAQDSED